MFMVLDYDEVQWLAGDSLNFMPHWCASLRGRRLRSPRQMADQHNGGSGRRRRRMRRLHGRTEIPSPSLAHPHDMACHAPYPLNSALQGEFAPPLVCPWRLPHPNKLTFSPQFCDWNFHWTDSPPPPPCSTPFLPLSCSACPSYFSRA